MGIDGASLFEVGNRRDGGLAVRIGAPDGSLLSDGEGRAIPGELV